MPKKKKRIPRKAARNIDRSPVKKIRKARVAENDINLLKEGHVPELSKLGEKFKGKNKIIVS